MNNKTRPPSNHDADRMRQIARLWTQAQPAVSALIGSTVIDFHDAEDLLGQVAETVITKACEYDPQRPFVPWAMGMTPRAVWTLLHRIRKSLAECIDRRLAALAQGGEL